MTATNCRPHRLRNCSICKTGTYSPRTDRTADDNPLADPLSPAHQAVYGGAYYGSTPDPSPSTSCESSSASSSSGGGSSSSYDSGSSSYDSGC